MEDPVVPLERNLYGHPLAGLLWERQFEKILLKHGWEKVSDWECLFVHREKGLFLSVYVDDIRLAGRKQNLDPMWKVLNKEVDLGEPTSFLDHVYLGCTQRKCETSKDIVDNYRTMFESRISAGGAEKLPFSQNFRISSCSYDMEGHAKKCVERYCELANKTTQQLYKVSTPCIDDHHFKEEETKSVGELSNACPQIVLKCLYLARIGRPDILWSVNKLARSVTKWTKVCDKRLNRLISYIHHTSEYKQYCHVGNTAKQCRLGLFQDSDFAGDLEDSKSTSGSLVEYCPSTAKDQSRIHQFGKNVLPGIFLGCALHARRIWNGDILVADNEELEKMDASEIHTGLNAKEVLTPTRGEKFIFPIADGQVKLSGGDQVLRTSTLIRDSLDR